VGSEPTAIDKIPCGDRIARRIISVGSEPHGYRQDPLRGSGWVSRISVGSEPTAIDKIPCGDRIARRIISVGSEPHGY
jgi:hypothetical protein